ncbi:hypothetical protein RJT34_19491 [Clitoria ternatea]|uniref:Spindle and kinetochore-associated protein 3 n=1 Tax=Clitoria ternatea TaxID=43366 RepID=A0AAN9IR47_CLITE
MAEDSISSFCNALAAFCNHLHSSSDALKLSIDRRPIPLDSASSTFVECLNLRVSSATSDLDMLDSMSFGTVSFEELLGHCNEFYKKNHADLLQLEDRLKNYGYVPGDLSSQELEKVQESKQQDQPVADIMISFNSDGSFLSDELDKKNLKSAEARSSTLKILQSEFECLPSYMKGLASWEDLLVAVDKINLCLSKKTNGCNFFRQDEIPSFELGSKARSYLLLLVRMNRLVVETIDGLLSYRVL